VGSLLGIRGGVAGVLTETNGQLQELEDDINNYWTESKRDRQDPQSDFMKFKLEVIGEDLPNTLSAVGGWYRGLGTTANNIANQTKGFGVGWTAAGLAAFKKYGVTPWIDTGSGDDRIGGPTDGVEIDPSFEGWDWQKDLEKQKEFPTSYMVGGKETPAPYQLTKEQRGKLESDIKVFESGGTPQSLLDQIKERQQPGYQAKIWTQGAGFAPDSSDPDWESSMEILESQIQEAQRTGGKGYYGDDDQGDTVYAEQVRKAYAERIAKRKLELQQEQLKRDNEEKTRIEDSIQKANETIYGPEGGISATGKFEHGGLLAERTDLSQAMRMKTLDEMDLTEQQRADLGEDYKIQAAPKTEAIYDEAKKEYVRPSGEIMELAKRMAAQLNYIASFEPLIAAAWQLSQQGLEGGNTGILRGTEAQRLIKKRSQAEEAHTRMMDQGAQDRLPYSLQEFQTRFPGDFPESDKGYGAGGFAAGGIVPGDIGEPQLITAHGGEQVSPIGMTGGRRGHTSNRVMNISINNVSSVRDILRDLNDMESMDDASFFNSVT